MLAAGGELIISDLDPPRFFTQYWKLIQNDPGALAFAFPAIMIATGLKVLESLLSITLIITQIDQACGGGVVVNDRAIGDGISGFQSRYGRSFIKLLIFPQVIILDTKALLFLFSN